MMINNKVIIWFLFIVSIGLIVYLYINKEKKFKSSTLCNINNDYLCNDGWKHICNDNSIIFVETQKLSDKSIIEYLHNVNYPFVLVTANNLALSSLTKDHLPIIENPKLIHWFGTHAGETHPKFSPLPLGPKWNWKTTEFGGTTENFEKNCKILNKARKSATESFGSFNRSNFVYWNMELSTTNSPNYVKEHKNIRNNIFQFLKNNEVINGKSTQNKDWETYLSDLRDSVFCISPPGKAPDAHRTWEALHMGCIPIVSSFEPLNSLYEDLPVIIVNDWSTINIPFLKKKQEEIYEKNILPSSLNKLSLKYWKYKIYSMLKCRSIIVEPRPHPALKAVLQNICEKLKTPITIVHGTKNKEFVHEIISDIPCVDLVIEINAEQLNSETYSKLLTTEEFWDKTRLNEPKVLIFQTDSGICGDGSDLSKYIKYNYCGAAWIWDKKQNKGGNGGFSIRDPEIAKKHIRQYGTHTYNEDVKFSEWCIKDKDCDICDYDTAKKFSSETVPSKSWAFHNNFSQGNYKSVCDFNDEIAKLNKNTPKYNYKIPDNNWRPTFTETYNKNKLNVTETYIKNKDISSYGSPEVKICLTSIPSRFDKLKPCLDSLLNQDYKKISVVLYLDHDDPHYTYPNVEIRRVEQHGCVTKFIYGVKDFPKNYILCTDDDVEYAPDLVSTYVNRLDRYPTAIMGMVAYSRNNYNPNDGVISTKFENLYKIDSSHIKQDTNVYCIINVGSTFLPPGISDISTEWFNCIKLFSQKDLTIMKLPKMKDGRWYIQDNIFMGFYAEKNGIQTILLSKPNSWGKNTNAHLIDSYSQANAKAIKDTGIHCSARTYNILEGQKRCEQVGSSAQKIVKESIYIPSTKTNEWGANESNDGGSWIASNGENDATYRATSGIFACSLLRPTSYMEIGVNSGTSLRSILHYCPTIDNVLLFSCDDKSCPGCFEYCPKCIEETRRIFPKIKIEIIWGNSHKTLKNYEVTQKFDIIHIDGDHSENGVYDDIKDCKRYAHDNTILICDDCGGPRRDNQCCETVVRGVLKAVRENIIIPIIGGNYGSSFFRYV